MVRIFLGDLQNSILPICSGDSWTLWLIPKPTPLHIVNFSKFKLCAMSLTMQPMVPSGFDSPGADHFGLWRRFDTCTGYVVSFNLRVHDSFDIAWCFSLIRPVPRQLHQATWLTSTGYCSSKQTHTRPRYLTCMNWAFAQLGVGSSSAKPVNSLDTWPAGFKTREVGMVT